MARHEDRLPLPSALLDRPQISLFEEVDAKMLETFLEQLHAAERSEGDVVLEMTTLGGDAELARRIVLEIQSARRRIKGRFLFLGKTTVYSAGMTIMSAFPVKDRYLTRDTMIMIHCRQLDKEIHISGSMRSSLPQIEAARAQVEVGLQLEEEGFRRLIEGSEVHLDELCGRAMNNWYLRAEDALARKLVAGLV